MRSCRSVKEARVSSKTLARTSLISTQLKVLASYADDADDDTLLAFDSSQLLLSTLEALVWYLGASQQMG